MTAFNCAPYPPLGVPRRQGCLGLLPWGCSSHRPRGNLRLSTSSFNPRIVRFCCIDLIVSDLPLVRPMCTVERGLSSESGSVSGPPTPSGAGWRRFPLERIPSGGFTRKSEGHDADEPDDEQHEDAPYTASRTAEQPLTGGGIDEVRVSDVGRAVHDDVFETDGPSSSGTQLPFCIATSPAPMLTERASRRVREPSASTTSTMI